MELLQARGHNNSKIFISKANLIIKELTAIIKEKIEYIPYPQLLNLCLSRWTILFAFMLV